MKRVEYAELNSRQQETYNLAELSWILAQRGYSVIRLSDDYNGADALAVPFDSAQAVLRIQLKSRPTVREVYRGKGLHLAFPIDGRRWVLIKHDRLLDYLLPQIGSTKSWKDGGGYSFPSTSKNLRQFLTPHLLEKGAP
jgi:hypothetical protein